jgi:NifU-like protein involved in Fe-S cluster formation
MSLVSETILEYAKNPPNKGILSSPTFTYDETNRSCGDSMTVYLKIENKGSPSWKARILEFSFAGDTAIITTAAAAMFGEVIIGLTMDEILGMTYADIREILGQDISPKRQMAACLGLLATRNGIHTYLWDGTRDDFSDLLLG